MSVLKKLGYLFDKKTKISLFILFVLLLLVSVAELLGITVVFPIMDLALDQGELQDNIYASFVMSHTDAVTKEDVLLVMIAATVVIYIIKNIYICFVFSRQFRFSAQLKRDLSTKLMRAYLKQPYSFFLKTNSAELIRSVNTDTSNLFQLISNVLNIFSNALTAGCIILFLAITNLMMTLFVSAVMGACLFIVIFVIQKKNRRDGYTNQYVNGQLFKHLKQAFEGVKEIKIMNIEKEFIESYDRQYRKKTELDVRFVTFNTMPKYLIEVFAVISVLGFMAINLIVNSDYMKLLPQLATFAAAAFKLLPSVNAIYSSINMAVYYKASLELVYNDIKKADEMDVNDKILSENIQDVPFEDSIRLEDVTFRYEGADEDVLKDVTFEIKKGQSVALIGASGGGKTTTADIILSLLEPVRGKVTVDGHDISENVRGWRKKIGYIPQFIYLTDETIRRNVAFGVDEDRIDDAQVWKVLEDAQLKEFVEGLPKGLDTVVGERGARISGGQRQRIGIARALYHDPEVLVFDEATSALDTETEKEVMKAVDKLSGEKTILMIAHRLSTIDNCDVVYRVEKGMITRER